MKKLTLFFFILLGLLQPLQALEITAVTEDYPPFEYMDGDEITGFTVELLELLYEKTGHTGKTYIWPWARAYKTALNEPNVLVLRMTRSKAREPLFKWIGKVSDKKIALFKLKSRNDIQLKVLDDAKEYDTGTIRGQSSTKFMYKKGFEEGVNTYSVANTTQNIRKLVSRRIDMILAMEEVLQFRLKEMGIAFDDVEEAIVVDNSSEFHMAFSQATSDEVVEQFRDAMEFSKIDGSFDRLWEKYFGGR